MWERHCRAALASLDFFVSVFYQEKIESLAGEADDSIEIISYYYTKSVILKCTLCVYKLYLKIIFQLQE